MYADWKAAALEDLAKIDAELGPDAPLRERRLAVKRHAREFHGGTSWGKKVWSREGRKYLERYGLEPITSTGPNPPKSTQGRKLFDRLNQGDIIFPFRGGDSNGNDTDTEGRV